MSVPVIICGLLLIVLQSFIYHRILSSNILVIVYVVYVFKKKMIYFFFGGGVEMGRMEVERVGEEMLNCHDVELPMKCSFITVFLGRRYKELK